MEYVKSNLTENTFSIKDWASTPLKKTEMKREYTGRQ